MKKTVFCLLLTLMLALSSVSSAQKSKKSSSKAAPAGPKITISETVFDAGEIVIGTPLSHAFEIKNTGKSELKISRVTAGCGCLATGFDRSVAPGKTGRVTLTVETYSDWVGQEVTQSALVETNDPEAQYLSLTIKAKILPPEPE